MKDLLKYLRLGAMSMVAALALASCSDDNNEDDPGNGPDPIVTIDTQGAHFDATNETTSILFASEAGRQVTYTLTRNDSKDELTIPMEVISATEGLIVPESVTFAAGSTSASYVVTAPASAKEGDSYTFEVSIVNADEFAEGATRFSATIAFPHKHSARMWFTGLVADYGYFLGDVYELDGSYLFPNFLSSSTDLWVRYDKSQTSTHECDLATEPGLQENDEGNPGCYYLYCWQELEDDENGVWTTFYPHGKDARVCIDEMTYYVSHDGYEATMYNPEGKSGFMLLSTVVFYDQQKESEKKLNWIQLNWVITDDPMGDGYDYSEPEPVEVDDNVAAKFAGTYTMTATDPQCDDATITPPTTNEIEIYVEDGEIRMSGLVGTAYDSNGENPGYYTGKYKEDEGVLYFYNESANTGSYEWSNEANAWYYTYDVSFKIVFDENGNVLYLENTSPWYFYGYSDDFYTASYGTIKLEKKN